MFLRKPKDLKKKKRSPDETIIESDGIYQENNTVNTFSDGTFYTAN